MSKQQLVIKPLGRHVLNERLTLPQFQGCGKGLLRQGHVDNQRSANFRRWTSGVGRAANGLGVKAFDALTHFQWKSGVCSEN